MQKTLCKTRECTRQAANRHGSKAPRYVCGQRMEKGLAADLHLHSQHLHAQILALPRVMSLAVFFIFYFVLFIDYFLFESLNILQQ